MVNENVEKVDVDITKAIPQTIKDAFLNGVAYDRAKNTLDTTAAEKLQFSLNTNEVLKNKYVSNCSDYITDYVVAVKNNLDPEAKRAFQKDYNKYMVAYSAGGTDGIAKFLRESYKEHGEELTVDKGRDLTDHKFREGDVILYKSDKVKGKEMGHGAMVFQENGQWFVSEMQGKEKGFEKTPLKEWLVARGDKEMTVGNIFLSLEKKLEKEPEIKEPKIKVEQPKPKEPTLDNREKDGEPKVKRKDIPDGQLPRHKEEPKPVKIESSVPNIAKGPTELVEPKIPNNKTAKQLESWRNETCGRREEEPGLLWGTNVVWRRDGDKCSEDTWKKINYRISEEEERERERNDKDNDYGNNRGNDGPSNGGGRGNDGPSGGGGRSGSSSGYNG